MAQITGVVKRTHRCNIRRYKTSQGTCWLVGAHIQYWRRTNKFRLQGL